MILITGGAGYIGSHTVKLLREKGYPLVVYDNLSRGHREAVVGSHLIEGDLLDCDCLRNTFESYEITDVIHFAALSLVGESMLRPDQYYLNNVIGTFNLLNAMREHNVQRIVFSSTAAVYGEPEQLPITEEVERQPTNVYGKTKNIIEQMLIDYAKAYGLRHVSLRYFNACGADASGAIGEDHQPETHLIPLVLRSTLKKNEKICIFGQDYATKDGTCIRDYIHVNDLARAHLLALEYLRAGQKPDVFNLGNGNGFSVQEVIQTAREITGSPISVEIAARREGDPAILVADAAKARRVLGWEPQYTDLKQIIATAWNWHEKSPEGFKTEK